MENSKKTSIYDNYAALCELHEAGRLSDEDFEKPGRDFDEKRKAAIAEYNAYNGPWPYQWKNIDAVVCGILQQHGVTSIDYTDLKYLYEADTVSEIRIKGKGANNEEQFQSIIDTIRNDYMDLLKLSKKVVVTLCGTSINPNQLEMISDCLSDMDVVWQSRMLPSLENLELSIVY
jgi:hypothetical protein